MNQRVTTFAALKTPCEYAFLPVAHLDASAQDVAYLYAVYARDKETGSADATSFEDALHQHQLIDQIMQTS
jgi:predicted dehydrogenase